MIRYSDGTDKLNESVKKIVSSFIKGGTTNTANGITDSVCAVLDSIIGSSFGVESRRVSYYVAVEGFSIVRVDVAIWHQNISAAQLVTNKDTDLFAYYAVKSAIDLNKIKFNTFLAVYQGVLLNAETKNASTITADLADAHKVFKFLKDMDNDTAPSDKANMNPVAFIPSEGLPHSNPTLVFPKLEAKLLRDEKQEAQHDVEALQGSILLGGMYKFNKRYISKVVGKMVYDSFKPHSQIKKNKTNDMETFWATEDTLNGVKSYFGGLKDQQLYKNYLKMTENFLDGTKDLAIAQTYTEEPKNKDLLIIRIGGFN
jgi:hypothetical protein